MQIEEADPVAVLKLAAGTDRLGHPAPQRIMSLTESISPCCRQNDLTAARPASQIAALHIMQISAALNLGTYMSQSTRPGPEHDRFSNGFDHQLTHSEVSCESADQISSVLTSLLVGSIERPRPPWPFYISVSYLRTQGRKDLPGQCRRTRCKHRKLFNHFCRHNLNSVTY